MSFASFTETHSLIDDIDWSVTTWEGNRREHHQAFLALPFREKMAAIEAMAEVADFFAARRRARLQGNGADDRPEETA